MEMKRRVTERQDDRTYVKVYRYRDYLHYKGSKKSITLRALKEVLEANPVSIDNAFTYSGIVLVEARKRASSEVVHHYGPV